MSLAPFEFSEPTRIVYGPGSVNRLKDILPKLGGKSVFFVTDKGLVKAGVAEKVINVLKECPCKLTTWDGVVENPLDTTIYEGLKIAQDCGADVLVALGGGSSMDTARAIAMLMTNGGTITEYFKGKAIVNPIKPLVCIPTTAGTGSEVTRTFVATDSKTKFKDGAKDENMCAAYAVLDPELMVSLPPKVTAATGLDALTHALEAYTTWKANPITDALNLHAIKLIGKSLRAAVARPANLEARGDMLLASCITGIAFDQSGLGLAHCMGHPLGGLFNIPHGVACAVALPVVMEFNLIGNPQKFADVAVALGENIEGLTLMEAAALSVDAVRSLMADVGLPFTLRELNVPESAIPDLARDAFAFQGMRGANPRVSTMEDIVALFNKIK